ncbi:hypothetical protein ACWCRC_42795, partial [Streptomyces sp. NPDC001940]
MPFVQGADESDFAGRVDVMGACIGGGLRDGKAEAFEGADGGDEDISALQVLLQASGVGGVATDSRPARSRASSRERFSPGTGG